MSREADGATSPAAPQAASGLARPAPCAERTRSGAAWRVVGRYWLPLLGWGATVLLLGGLAQAPLLLPHRLGPVPVDKALHFLEYGLLGALALRVFAHGFGGRLTRAEALVATALLCVSLASLDEAHQYGVSGRSMDLADLAADLPAAAMAAGAYWLLRLRPRAGVAAPADVYRPQP